MDQKRDNSPNDDSSESDGENDSTIEDEYYNKNKHSILNGSESDLDNEINNDNRLKHFAGGSVEDLKVRLEHFIYLIE